MCSTFKVLAAALVLTRVDRGEENLERRIVYAKERVVAYSPETEKHAGAEGMSLGEICKAGLTLSDNTAANLILESFGGPAELTKFARAIGDDVTRLDRVETALERGEAGRSARHHKSGGDGARPSQARSSATCCRPRRARS